MQMYLVLDFIRHHHRSDNAVSNRYGDSAGDTKVSF